MAVKSACLNGSYFTQAPSASPNFLLGSQPLPSSWVVLSPPFPGSAQGLNSQVVQLKRSHRHSSPTEPRLERPRALQSPLPNTNISHVRPLPPRDPCVAAFLRGPFLSSGGHVIQPRSSPAAGTMGFTPASKRRIVFLGG